MENLRPERRKSQRYPAVTPVHLESSSGIVSARSRDLSAAGAYVFTAEPLVVGHIMDVKFTLPHEDMFRQDISFRGRAAVLRVEPQPTGDFGIALAFYGVRIQPAE